MSATLPVIGPAPQRDATPYRWARLRAKLIPYGFIAPNLALFTFAPLLYAIYISFNDWSLIGDPEWLGLANYRRLLHDPLFWQSLANTAVYGLATVPTSMALGLALALDLNRRLPGRTLIRSVYFMPVVISAVATGTIAAWLFNDNFGVINLLRSQVNLEWGQVIALALISLAPMLLIFVILQRQFVQGIASTGLK